MELLGTKIKIMAKNALKSILCLCSLWLLMSSCQGALYNEEKVLENEIWAYSNPLSFEFMIEDTTEKYNVFLELKHREDFGTANAYAKLFVKFPDGKEREQQVSFELADSKGEWYGKCSGGSCVNRLSFMPDAVFEQAGNYQIRFQQYTRKDSLEGLQSLRLIVEKVKPK